MNKLKNLGFNQWFDSHLDDKKAEFHKVARVISVHKDSYMITNGDLEAYAQLSGHLFYTSDTALDIPTVGDWVYADFYDDDHAIIHGLMPRQTVLKRKAAGKSIDFQLIAANIDVALIIQSVNENFNLRRLERYLVIANESRIKPIILLSKSDLVAQTEIDDLKDSIKSIALDIDVQEFSNITGENIDRLNELLIPKLTFCLLGSSGVGKTTLLNTLLGGEEYKTQNVSKIQSKGRHTTTSRELVLCANGAMIIDTPGMRELGSLSNDSGLDETFSEILELNEKCKYRDCSHSSEKGCAILKALDSGELSKKRYKNYLKMKKESDFNEMSYLDKRKKDKDFGKIIKSALKNKKR
jgi:ribosome biogenesis GTPase